MREVNGVAYADAAVDGVADEDDDEDDDDEDDEGKEDDDDDAMTKTMMMMMNKMLKLHMKKMMTMMMMMLVVIMIMIMVGMEMRMIMIMMTMRTVVYLMRAILHASSVAITAHGNCSAYQSQVRSTDSNKASKYAVSKYSITANCCRFLAKEYWQCSKFRNGTKGSVAASRMTSR